MLFTVSANVCSTACRFHAGIVQNFIILPFMCYAYKYKWSSGNHCHIVSAVVSDADEGALPEISGHGPIFSVYSSVYAIVEVNGRRWELGIKHRR